MFSMRLKAEMGRVILVLLYILPAWSHKYMDINRDTVHRIHSNLDVSVEPCQNFWAHACGNWSYNYVDNFQQAEESYASAMVSVLGSNGKTGWNDVAPRLLNQMVDYFTACVSSTLEEVQLPNELFFGHFEWTRETAKLRKYGLNGVFFDETVDVAFNDSLHYVVQLKMPASQENSLPDAFTSFEVQQVERDLRKLRQKYRKAEQVLRSWTLGTLKQEIPQIDWQIYFSELLGMEIEDTQLLLEVCDVEYLRALGNYLNSSNKATLKEYLRAQMTSFAREVLPRSGPISRSHICIHHMRAILPLGMNYIYDRYVYRTRAEDSRQLHDLFTDLRATFGKYLESNQLQLSSDQLDYLHAKLANMKLKLGNLPDEASVDFYDNHYSSTRFVSFNFHENVWEALRLRTRLQHTPLKQPGANVQLKHYYVNDDLLTARNAPYFEPERNTLTVPMIFLQWPFYNNRQHLVFRYSLMGFILSHELSHAFEQDGILFDGSGNESILGLQIRQTKTFQAALQCVQRTPTASLKERLADVTGLQLSYDTFFGMQHNSQQFNYQPYAFEDHLLAPQLFHLNFAQFFCGRLPPAIGHDMDNVRVNQAEQNLHQFSIDFSCQQQSSSGACEMWRPSRN